jgi:thioester reductase-like protein
MTSYTLLTGATGLVGHYLLRDLLQAGHRLALVVRPARGASSSARIEAALQMWERELGAHIPRPVVFAGDVAEENLGLSCDARCWISANCQRILHNAAILTFHGNDRQGEPWRTNLQGTRNSLEFCRNVGLRDFHYVSTAYVCGKREGIIGEDELDVGQEFRNDYEHSKCLAEQAVRTASFIDPPTVYRPVVIAGDSQTGFTNTYHGLFVYLRLISLALGNTPMNHDGRRYTPLRLPLYGNEQRNVVPVDWVTRVIRHLMETSAASGLTFHLAPRIPMTTRDLFDAAYSYFNSYGVEYCGPDWREDSDGTMYDNLYSCEAASYREYELSDPQFDTSNLRRFAAHLPCPLIDETLLHRYWSFGEQDNWGKRRSSKLQVAPQANDVLPAAPDTLDPPRRRSCSREGRLALVDTRKV